MALYDKATSASPSVFACSGCLRNDRPIGGGRASCGGYPICPLCGFTVVPSKSNPGKFTCQSACGGWKSGMATLQPFRAQNAPSLPSPAQPLPAPVFEAEQEAFDVLSAKLRERAESCLSSMAKLGHETPPYLVLNPYSRDPLRLTCGACGEHAYVEQKRFVQGLSVHGVATGLDCKQMQRKKNP